MDSKKLNLGCGKDIKPGWVNLDSAKLSGVDVVWDIEKLPLPFGNEEFDEILANDILEHVEYIPVLLDLHRILKSGGKLEIRVPHFTSVDNFADPTHKKMFSVLTFTFFAENPAVRKLAEREYYFDFHFKKIARVKITFEHGSRLFLFNRLIEPLVNINLKMQYFYEATALSRLFPAKNIIVKLIK